MVLSPSHFDPSEVWAIQTKQQETGFIDVEDFKKLRGLLDSLAGGG